MTVQIFCIVQFSLFGWQTVVVKDQRDRAGGVLYPYNQPWQGDQQRYYQEGFYQSREYQHYTRVFCLEYLL
jgi:hypothetical protein